MAVGALLSQASISKDVYLPRLSISSRTLTGSHCSSLGLACIPEPIAIARGMGGVDWLRLGHMTQACAGTGAPLDALDGGWEATLPSQNRWVLLENGRIDVGKQKTQVCCHITSPTGVWRNNGGYNSLAKDHMLHRLSQFPANVCSLAILRVLLFSFYTLFFGGFVCLQQFPN